MISLLSLQTRCTGRLGGSQLAGHRAANPARLQSPICRNSSVAMLPFSVRTWLILKRPKKTRFKAVFTIENFTPFFLTFWPPCRPVTSRSRLPTAKGGGCLPAFYSNHYWRNVEKWYRISTACAQSLRRNFKFPDRLFYSAPSLRFGLKNLPESLLKPFPSPESLCLSGPRARYFK